MSRNKKAITRLYLVSLHDLLNKAYTYAAIQPMRKRNEFAALFELIDRHTPDVEGLIRKHMLPVRPNRNFACQQRFQVPVSFTYRF